MQIEPPAEFAEADWDKWSALRCRLLGELLVLVCLDFCRSDVAQSLHQSMMVEPGHAVQRGDLHRLAHLPRPAPVDQLGLVKPVLIRNVPQHACP